MATEGPFCEGRMVNVAPPCGTVSLVSSFPWWPGGAPAAEGGNSATLRRANQLQESPSCLYLAWWGPSRAQSTAPWLVRTRLPGTRICDSAQSGRTSGAREGKERNSACSRSTVSCSRTLTPYLIVGGEDELEDDQQPDKSRLVVMETKGHKKLFPTDQNSEQEKAEERIQLWKETEFKPRCN